MIFYINGDSHAAGAEINNPYSFASGHLSTSNDWTPHPENIVDSFGHVLARKLGYKNIIVDAESGASNDKILRTTKSFLKKNTQKVFVLIGWSTTDRKDFRIYNRFYSFSPGFQTNDPNLKIEFKKYILSLDHAAIVKQNYYWHHEIYKFHLDLKENKIPHLFFNTFDFFNRYNTNEYEKIYYNWDNRMIGAYNENENYFHWLKHQGFNTVNKNSFHYGADGHAAWANRLYNWLTDHRLL